MRHIRDWFNTEDSAWQCPMVAVTGNADSPDIAENLLRAGAVHVLGKPVSTPKIRDELIKSGLLPAYQLETAKTK